MTRSRRATMPLLLQNSPRRRRGAGAWATGAANSPRWRRMQFFLHGARRGRQMRSLGCLNVCVARYTQNCGFAKVGDVSSQPARFGNGFCDESSNLRTPLTRARRVQRAKPRPSPGHHLSGTIARVPSPLAHRSTSSTITAPRHAICTAVTGAEANRLNARHS